MSDERNYPARYSRVSVTLNDGEVKDFDITAGCGLLKYLMQEAGNTGSLVILEGDEAHAIPMERVSDVTMKQFDTPEARAAFYAPTKSKGKPQ